MLKWWEGHATSVSRGRYVVKGMDERSFNHAPPAPFSDCAFMGPVIHLALNEQACFVEVMGRAHYSAGSPECTGASRTLLQGR